MKKLVSLLAATAIALTSAVNVFAAYGDEWASSPYDGKPAATAAPIAGENGGASYVPTVQESYGTYKDVPTTHWAYDAIERCSIQNWFSGYPDGRFNPDGKITRAEAMKVFVTFMGENVQPVTSTSYHDVLPTAWYAPFIEAGKELFPQRTTMTSELKFQPDMPILREDTVYALVKAKRYDKLTAMADLSVLNMFSDQNSISSICKPYLAVAVSNQLMSGYNDGTVRAQEPLTRAQFATLLYRATNIGELPETDKKLSRIEIQPQTLKEIMVGESFEITATAYYSDGSTEDYTNNLNPYVDNQEDIVNINRNKIKGVQEGSVIVKYNNDNVRDQQLVVIVKKDPTLDVTPEPTSPSEVEPPIIDDDEPIEVPDSGSEEKGKVELAFVIDSTGSMGEEISNVKMNITDFAKHLESKGVDLKMTVVEYRDITCDGLDSTKVHLVSGSPWHTTAEQLVTTLENINANGGGDADETAIDAFARILDNRYMSWSKEAYKFVVLLTDAGYKLDNVYEYTSLNEITDKLASKNINTSIIVPSYLDGVYDELSDETGGIKADIMSDFANVLNSLADKIMDVSL